MTGFRLPLRSRFFPFLNWPAPSLALFRGEALAGVTVGLMVIPQGVAYASLAGMPLVTGIYASLLPALVAVLFGASTRLSVGPTALTCLLVGASLTGLAEPSSPEWVGLAVWLALFSGGLQVLLGLGRFGWLLNLVSAPVLMAFTQAAAVLIIGSQLPHLLGTPGWSEIQSLFGQGVALSEIPAPHAMSMAFGLGSLAILIIARRMRPTFPSVLLVVVGSSMLSRWLEFSASGGAVVGALPMGLPVLQIPQWPEWSTLAELVLPVLVITLVSFLETASSAKVDSDRKGQIWDQDQDLIGQGLGKLAAGFSGAFPTSSSFSRSALNLYAGAQTGWATVCSVIVVLAALWFLLPVLFDVPQAVLSAIVLVAVFGLIQPRQFLRLWKISRVECGIAGMTFVLTLAAAPRLYWGVLAGVMVALSHFLYYRLHPRIIEVGLHPDGRLRDRHLWQLPPLAPATCALRMDAALDFGSATALESEVAKRLGEQPDLRQVVLFAQPINWIDATGVEAFGRLRRQLASQNRILIVVGLKLPVESALMSAGELQPGDDLRLFATDREAIDYLAASPAENPPGQAPQAGAAPPR